MERTTTYNNGTMVWTAADKGSTVVSILAVVLLAGVSACAATGAAREPLVELDPQHTYDTDAATQRAYHEYLDWIEAVIIPRVEAEVREMMRRGWVRSLNQADLWHLHIGYPRSDDVTGEDTQGYHLLYHSMERPHEMRHRWIAELSESENEELSSRMALIKEHEFDYHEFFFSSGRYSRPAPLQAETVARYARLWAAEDSPEIPPRTERLREYRNRITFLIGSAQPGYTRAAHELLQTSSVVSRSTHTASAAEWNLTPVDARYLPGYDYPVTIVFAAVAHGRPFFGVSRMIEGEELIFGVRFDVDIATFLGQSWIVRDIVPRG